MIRRRLKQWKDPFFLYRSVREHCEASFFLESLVGPQRFRELTIMGFDPQMVVRYQDGRLTANGDGVDTGDPFAFLRQLLAEHRTGEAGKYVGGLVGYVSYDFVRHLERLPDRHRKPSPFPDFELGLFLDGIVFDHLGGEAFYFSHGEDRLEDFLETYRPPEPAPLSVQPLEPEVRREEFEASVLRAKEEIAAGEVFQVVLSRRDHGRCEGDLMAFYEQLRWVNPSPYMYFIDFGGRKVVGSSPETLLNVQGDRVTTFPIAGTRPLGRNLEERRRLREELLADEKERAEHNMLVDLARNDVGRVCRFGTVAVPEYMTVEEFSHVQHIVSKVVGQLKPGHDALDALAALFPAGTVTGAPKLRAMEIIEALEPSRRGPYAGIVGYMGLNGNMDTAISIRTLMANGRDIEVQAGAGIVADSDPGKEWMETEHKLAALQAALSSFKEA
jgi:anthranilate synthase component 1